MPRYNHFPTEWRIPETLLASDVERWVAAVPSNCASVSVTIGKWEQTGPFADARLQGALCIFHRKGIRTSVNVPQLTLSEQRAFNAFKDSDPLAPPRNVTPAERTLAGTVAGLVIGQLCKFDARHQRIPILQREILQTRRYLIGTGSEAALAIPTELIPTGIPRKSTLEREATLNNRLVELLEPLGTTDQFSPSASDWFSYLKSFALEATDNTWDHGRLDFEMKPIQSVRFVRLRRIDVGDKGYDAAKLAPGFEESFKKYIECLNVAEDLPGRWRSTGGRLVEITIADGGVGISARMAGGFEIYQDALQTETDCLLDALAPGSTTKSPSEVGRGQGFRKMLRACFNLSGLVIVRTGRLKLSRTYRQRDGTCESVDFNDSHSSAYLPETSDLKLPLVAGTSISMMFPIHPRDLADRREGN